MIVMTLVIFRTVKRSKRMEIAVTVNYFSPFIRSNEYYLCKKLSEKGYAVTLYTADVGHKRARYTLHDIGAEEIEGFKVKRLKTMVDFVENPFYPSIYGEIKRGKYDLVHSHEDWQIGTFLSYLAAKSMRTPFVLSEERYYPPGRLKPFFVFFDWEFATSVRENANVITAHSTAAKRYLVEKGVSPERVKVISVGIDTELFKPIKNSEFRERLGIKSGEIVILNVARLHPYKGQRFLIEAFKKVKMQVNNTKLIILGRGSLKESLIQLIGELKLQNDVFLLDEAYSNDFMPSVYANCDIFCLPSRVEPFGISVLEAMACGKPVVGAKVGGISDTINDGEVGFLINPVNVDDLSSKLMNLVLNERLRKELGNRALARAKTVFDWNLVVKKYVELYEQLTSN